MLTVIAEIKARPGRRAAVLNAFEKLIPLVLAEDGCGGYAPLVDAPSEAPWQKASPDSIFMLEQWASMAHLEAHMAAAHMLQHRDNVKDDVAEVTIHVLRNAL